jgi:hypothetical protein
MINSALDCGFNGWLMVASGVVTFSMLALAGAALVKYLFFANRTTTAA